MRGASRSQFTVNSLPCRLKRATSSKLQQSARERDVNYSPDGKWLAFISDRSGREELYLVAVDGAGEAQKLTDIDALKFGYNWSPDSKEIAFTSSDSKLRKINVASKQMRRSMRRVTEISRRLNGR